MVENDPGHSEIPPVLETLWWGLSAGREATVAISNTGDQRASADLFLEFQGTRHPSASLDFRPHETKVLSVSEFLSELEVSPAQAPEGGITIIARGENPILMAQGKILDATTGFSTTLHFPLPQRQRASALHASGVPIGTPSNNSPFAGMGTFTPHVIVRNLSPATQNVRITVEYPTEKGSDLAVLPPFALDANTTQGISLDSVMGELPLPLPYCSIRIQYSGPPGSAMAEVSSIEEKGNLVIDSRFANEGDGWAGSGANPWHIDAETESFLFLSNMGEKESRIGLQIKADGVLYNVTDLKLGPHETRAIRLRELRDAQRPDFQGNKIPAGATDGSVSWIRLDLVPVMGRLVVMQPGKGIVSNYDCCPCSCPPSFYGVATNPLTVDLLPNTTVNCTCQAQYLDCNQVVVSSDATSSATWSSGNTAVATVDNSVFKGRVTGIDGGSSNIAATITDYQCFSDPLGNCTLTAVVISGGITVRTRVARWAVLGSDSGMVNTANCPFTPGALERNRVYAGYDDFGRVPFNQNWTLNERLVSPTNCGAILGGNDFIVDFTDTISVCQTACTLQTEQTFTINARLVGARDCADFTNPACAAHTGWRVAASYNFSTLTPY